MAGATLALDQSLSSTGWALWHEGAASSGDWPLCDGMRHRAIGFVSLFRKLVELHERIGLNQIVYEQPILMRIDKVPKLVGLYGLIAIIELFAESRNLPGPIGYPSGSWRGTFFSIEERKSMRERSKEQRDWKIPAIMRSRQLGFDPVTDDEAEAIAILDHHLHKRGVQPPWRKGSPWLDPVA